MSATNGATTLMRLAKPRTVTRLFCRARRICLPKVSIALPANLSALVGTGSMAASFGCGRGLGDPLGDPVECRGGTRLGAPAGRQEPAGHRPAPLGAQRRSLPPASLELADGGSTSPSPVVRTAAPVAAAAYDSLGGAGGGSSWPVATRAEPMM